MCIGCRCQACTDRQWLLEVGAAQDPRVAWHATNKLHEFLAMEDDEYGSKDVSHG
jgi:hypothetical protein